MAINFDETMNLTVIAQGILGSAIFWLILKVASSAKNIFTKYIFSFSQKKRRDFLETEKFRYESFLSKDNGRIQTALTALIYDALRSFLTAVSVAIAGAILSTMYPAFLYISLMFSLYYIALAMIEVRDLHSSDEDAMHKRLEEIEAELKLLEKIPNKSSRPAPRRRG